MGITFDRSEFNADITSKMDDIRENYLDDGEGDDVAFAYTVAAVFEGEDILSDENSFIYTDGANDHGVDFTLRAMMATRSINANRAIWIIIQREKCLTQHLLMSCKKLLSLLLRIMMLVRTPV